MDWKRVGIEARRLPGTVGRHVVGGLALTGLQVAVDVTRATSLGLGHRTPVWFRRILAIRAVMDRVEAWTHPRAYAPPAEPEGLTPENVGAHLDEAEEEEEVLPEGVQDGPNSGDLVEMDLSLEDAGDTDLDESSYQDDSPDEPKDETPPEGSP